MAAGQVSEDQTKEMNYVPGTIPARRVLELYVDGYVVYQGLAAKCLGSRRVRTSRIKESKAESALDV